MHALVQYSKEFPGLGGTQHVARREMVDKFPQTAKDFVRATLQARRKLQDQKTFTEMLVKYLKLTPEQALTTTQNFGAQDLWSLNGGMDNQMIQSNLDFLVEAGTLKAGLKPSEVVDLSILNAVLDEIGRK